MPGTEKQKIEEKERTFLKNGGPEKNLPRDLLIGSYCMKS